MGNRSFAIVRVPFGWHQAPGLVQHLIATVIAHVDPGSVVVVQYLDDIVVVGRQKPEVQRVTDDVRAALRDARFLIGAKSILTPAAEVTWMGKTVNAQVGKIQPTPVAVADCVVRWIRMAVAQVTRVSLTRLLGRLVWLGRPGNTAAAFWSGARAEVGTQGSAQRCHRHLGGSLLRAAWPGACLHPRHLYPRHQPVCGRCARVRRVLGWCVGPSRTLDQALPALGDFTAASRTLGSARRAREGEEASKPVCR